MKEAMLYEKLEDGRVQCHLCAHECTIGDGAKGLCQVRENAGGTLHTLVYGRTISQNVDPIEKKPLFHVYPGSKSFSIATPGCNLRCQWCQNADISQMPRERHLIAGDAAPPEAIVEAASRTGCRSIAYTYTEPTIFFEYAYDTARLANGAGLANVYVTNGFMTSAALDALHPYLDAANVDLKAFRDETYRKYAGARLQPVLDSLKKMKAQGVWVEVTTLVIPGINDDVGELEEIVSFIANELGPETPWHISRFFPMYEMTYIPPTPISTLKRAFDVAKEGGLHYVYVGNVRGGDGEDTECPGCGKKVIERTGYCIRADRVRNGACPDCETPIAGLGMGG